jgi:hypothetical protein
LAEFLVRTGVRCEIIQAGVCYRVPVERCGGPDWKYAICADCSGGHAVVMSTLRLGWLGLDRSGWRFAK